MADAKAQIVLSAVNRTKAAFAEVQGQFDKLKSSSAAAVLGFTALGGAVTAAFGAINLKSAIDTLDRLDDLSEKSGIAVERFSELRFAGESVGTSFDDLAAGTSKLARNMAAAAGGSKQTAAAFEAINVSVKNTDGTLRSTEDVLLDIADRFAGYRDGAAKSALAVELFGKSGETLIPILNQGRAGIEELAQEARDLGAVFGADVAKNAATLNDNIKKIQLASEGAAATIGGPLIAKLAELSGRFVTAAKNGTLFEDSLKAIFTFSPVGTVKDLIAERYGLSDDKARQLQDRADGLRNIITGLEVQLGRDPGNAGLERRLARLRKELAGVEDQARAARQAADVGGGRGNTNPNAVSADERPDAPVVDDGSGASERERLLRTRLQGRLQALQDGFAKERDLVAFQGRALQQEYDAGNQSLSDFYAERGRLAQQALVAQQSTIDQQIAALRQYASATQDANSRVDAENQVNNLLRDRAKLAVDAARDVSLAAGEQSRAQQSLDLQVQELKASILELGGNETEAALLRLQTGLRNVSVLLNQSGADPSLIARFKQLNEASIEQARIRREVGQLTEQAALAEEEYLLAADKAGLSQEEVEKRLIELRNVSLEQLRGQAAAARALATANPDNKDLDLLAKSLETSVLRAEQVIDPALDRIKARSADAAQAFANAAGEFAISRDAESAIENLDRALQNLVIQILVVEPIARKLRQTLEGLGKSSSAGGGGGGGLPDSIGGFIGDILASAKGNVFDGVGHVKAFAKGGVVDSPTFFKFASGGSFANGLMGEAGPEGVLPLKRLPSGDLGVQAAGSGQSITYAPTFILEQPVNRQTQDQIAAKAYAGAQRAFSRLR